MSIQSSRIAAGSAGSAGSAGAAGTTGTTNNTEIGLDVGVRGSARSGTVGKFRAIRAEPTIAQVAGAADVTQQRVLDAPAGRNYLVWGAAGTGKSWLAAEVTAQRIERGDYAPDQVMVLAATRARSAELRDRLAHRLAIATGSAMVRTASSLAFAILRLAAMQAGAPAPQLMTGPDFDAHLRDLLEGHALIQSGPRWPDRLTPEVRDLVEFRTELRDVLMRAAEADLDGAGLIRLGQETGRHEWVAAGEILRESEQVQRLSQAATPDAARKYHSSQLISAAAGVLLNGGVTVSTGLRGAGGAATWQPPWRLLVVDDAQEMSEATARLIDQLAVAGVDLIFLYNPDTAVQTFRGAVPGLAAHASERWSRKTWQEFTLGVQHRATSRNLSDLGLGVAQHLPQPNAAGRVALTLANELDAVADVVTGAGDEVLTATGSKHHVEPTSVSIFESAEQENLSVAALMRRAHLEDGIPWNDMAVIVRSSSIAYRWRTALNRAGVQTSYSGNDLPLHAHDSIWPLLRCIRVALAPDLLSVDTAESLLCSVYGRSNSVELRRLRRHLRFWDKTQGQSRASDDLLREVMLDLNLCHVITPDLAECPPDAWQHSLMRIAAMVAAAQDAISTQQGLETVLWMVWEASGQSEKWRQQAFGSGPLAESVDQNLDSVLMLFAAAARAVDHNSHMGIAAFLSQLEQQNTAEDNLAHAERGGVMILTPSAAAGREWSHVFVCSVQEGSWPNTKLRSTLLGAGEIADAVNGRGSDRRDQLNSGSVPEDAHASAIRRREARRLVVADELRFFATAVTRARESAHVTSYLTEEDAPSTFVRLVRSLIALNTKNQDATGQHTSVPDAAGSGSAPATADTFDQRFELTPNAINLDLRVLVAQLRRSIAGYDRAKIFELEHGVQNQAAPVDLGTMSELVQPARELLAYLTSRGVTCADPQEWYHAVQISRREALFQPDQLVPLSPSSLEALNQCSLRWHLQRSGGDSATSSAQTLGTLIHELAAEHPDGDLDTLTEAFNLKWQQLKLDDSWSNRRDRVHLETMLKGLSAYFKASQQLVAVEAPFAYELHGARVRGSADRIESTADGYRVVDFKTGKTAVTRDEATVHPQLAAYQLAIREGGIHVPNQTSVPSLVTADGEYEAEFHHLPPATPRGGVLVYLGHTLNGYKALEQPPLHTEQPTAGLESDDKNTTVEHVGFFELEEPTVTGPISLADTLIRDAVAQVRSPNLLAQKNTMCDHCAVARCCPLFSVEVTP